MNTKIDELKAKKKALKLTNMDIASEAKIPLSTVQKIFAGSTQSPRYKTLEKIEEVIGTHAADVCAAAFETGAENAAVKEPLKVYECGEKERRSHPVRRTFSDPALESFARPFTTDDYYMIPDDIRVELIDGRIYDMTAPTIRHQDILTIVKTAMVNYIIQEGKRCKVWESPVDVRLDRDEHTMVQPDLVCVCLGGDEDDRIKTGKRIDGAPDFVMEVLSPSSVEMDTGLKLVKYLSAGVREYWIADPGREKVEVYVNSPETAWVNTPRILNKTEYSFEDVVPVGITEGELVIDFNKVKDYIDMM